MYTVDRKLGSSIYCTFHKRANSEVQKPTDDCVFRCFQSSYLNEPLRKQNFSSRVQKVMVCDLWISIRFVFLWARSIQPKFPKISVQNSMDRFGPTGKVSKKRVHLNFWGGPLFPVGPVGILVEWIAPSVSRFVACDLNYDWRQRKTKLWSLEFACLWKAQQSLRVVRGPWIRRDQWAVGCLF